MPAQRARSRFPEAAPFKLTFAENPKPQYAWGFDSAGADTKTRPGDDFFRYANGRWLDTTEIPPDKPAATLRLAMSDVTEERLHESRPSWAVTIPISSRGYSICTSTST